MSDEIGKLAEECASKLAEHYDSVRIFITRQADGSNSETEAYSTGRGNFYTQIGQIKEWVIQQDEHVRNNTRDREEG